MIRPLPLVLFAPALAWFGAPAPAADSAPPVFRAGAAAANVSPWLGLSLNGQMHDRRTTYVRDELHARAVVLEAGGTRLALCVADSCMIPDAVVLDAKKRIAEGGIPPERVLISATHTHTAPCAAGVFQSDPDPEYQVFLARRIAGAVLQAAANLEPAEFARGSVEMPDEVFNRRWFKKPGTIPPDPFGGTSDKVQMNPRPGDPDLIEPAGPVDPEVSWLALRAAGGEGRPLAVLANYSVHYVGGDSPGHASADYFGVFAREIEARLGASGQEPSFVGILSNGTSGDANHTDFTRPSPAEAPYARMNALGAKVAARVAESIRAASFAPVASLASAAAEIELAIRKPSPAEVEMARAVLSKAEGRSLNTLEEIYARETVLLDPYPPSARLVLQVFRIGDLRVAAIPCEVFTAIGLEIKRRAAPGPAFTIELANGYHGYLPTKEAFEQGGYETWRARSSHLETGAAEKVLGAVEALMDSLK